MTKAVLALLVASAMSTSLIEAQSPAQGAAVTPPANLAQLMRGTFYPESNVVFAAQDVNPADVPHAKDPSHGDRPPGESVWKMASSGEQRFGDR